MLGSGPWTRIVNEKWVTTTKKFGNHWFKGLKAISERVKRQCKYYNDNHFMINSPVPLFIHGEPESALAMAVVSRSTVTGYLTPPYLFIKGMI